VCEQLAQGRYLTAKQPEVELATSWVASQCPNNYITRPQVLLIVLLWIPLNAVQNQHPRQRRTQGGIKFISPKLPKLDLTTDRVAN